MDKPGGSCTASCLDGIHTNENQTSVSSILQIQFFRCSSSCRLVRLSRLLRQGSWATSIPQPPQRQNFVLCMHAYTHIELEPASAMWFLSAADAAADKQQKQPGAMDMQKKSCVRRGCNRLCHGCVCVCVCLCFCVVKSRQMGEQGEGSPPPCTPTPPPQLHYNTYYTMCSIYYTIYTILYIYIYICIYIDTIILIYYFILYITKHHHHNYTTPIILCALYTTYRYYNTIYYYIQYITINIILYFLIFYYITININNSNDNGNNWN